MRFMQDVANWGYNVQAKVRQLFDVLGETLEENGILALPEEQQLDIIESDEKKSLLMLENIRMNDQKTQQQ